MKIIKTSFSLVLLIILVISCKPHSVTRVNPDQQIDLSGRWNDTDSKLVAQEMIKDCLGRPWISNFSNPRSGKKPTVILGIIANKSSEHIDAETFVTDMEREFINGGEVRVVQSSSFREKLRQERADQQEFASPDTQKKWGRELGADFMLFGTINSIVDTYNKRQVTYYQVDLNLTDLETNEIVWLGTKKIKKYIVK